ncbi:MAG: Integral membrane protein TerC [uncultured Aureispira sp.]|uniref:Integral membrane protein TerC n=1 Tax=uncultured Aureispira sp. TaxID=1331704 RepID=A0A6S6SM72_9BACT|nr:MAG: Integral membrane protein TerC [uncultured Aureispira sp.]
MDFAATLELFSTSQAWISLGMLTLMEIVLGIDNIIFISIVANKLPEEQQAKARNIGLFLAMLLRIILLFGITIIVAMQDPLFELHIFSIHAKVTGQSLILMLGGLFLLYKSVTEIHHKLEGINEVNTEDNNPKNTLSSIILQICLLNIVFSFDSILTAVGLTQDVANTPMLSDPSRLYDPLSIMILGVVISMIIMMAFAGPIGRFVDKHPSIQVLGLSFLILIGFMLIVEGAHSAHLMPPNVEIPKGYMYFAIFFSLTVEFLNIKVRQRGKPVQLKGALQEAKERDLYNLDPTNDTRVEVTVLPETDELEND